MSRIILFLVLLVCQTAASGKIVLEDFEKLPVRVFPDGWKVRKGFWYTGGKNNKTWFVNEENGNKYLSAISKADAFTIGKRRQFDLEEYKYLSWKWRVRAIPEVRDEKGERTGDSAAGVYVVFKGRFIPYTIKYVWSGEYEPGTVLTSRSTKRCKIIVLRSREDPIDEWVVEKRNVLEDFARVFPDRKPDNNPLGIALLSDSDNTKSCAMADYDDLFITTD